MSSDVEVEIDGPVMLVTLNRPEKLNAYRAGMGQLLTSALRQADQDDAVRVVVITGAGRAFCAGADFSTGTDSADTSGSGNKGGVFAAPTGEFSSDPLDDFHPWDCRKPVLAAINGPAVGIGLTLTFQCDIRIVARDAVLGVVQVRRGIIPDMHAHWTLPRLVGHSRATELLLTGRTFNGSDAAEWGLATEALDSADVLPRTLELATEIARGTAPVSVGLSKRLLWMSAPDAPTINDLEHDLHLHLMGTDDSLEGMVAYMEKRDPQWSLSVTRDWPDWLDERTKPDGPPTGPAESNSDQRESL